MSTLTINKRRISFNFQNNLTENQLEKYLIYLNKNIPDSMVYVATETNKQPHKKETLNINLEKEVIIPLIFEKNVHFGTDMKTNKDILGFSGYSIPPLYSFSDKKDELIEKISQVTKEFFKQEYNTIKNNL